VGQGLVWGPLSLAPCGWRAVGLGPSGDGVVRILDRARTEILPVHVMRWIPAGPDVRLSWPSLSRLGPCLFGFHPQILFKKDKYIYGVLNEVYL